MERPQYHNIKLVRWKEQWNVMEGNGTERDYQRYHHNTTKIRWKEYTRLLGNRLPFLGAVLRSTLGLDARLAQGTVNK